MITVNQLKEIMPNLNLALAVQYLPFLNDAMLEAEINRPLRQAAFLAQVAHESGELKYFQELASGKAYEGRKDLGNTQPGDGVRFKGRSPIQITGRANYRDCGKALGINLEEDPDRADDLDCAFRVACWFWTSRKLNVIADQGNFDLITKKVNGGYNGKASRDKYYKKAKEVLGVE